jgi:hypothetical protein
MEANDGNTVRKIVARADQLSERKIFWTMIATALVAIALMMQGMLR